MEDNVHEVGQRQQVHEEPGRERGDMLLLHLAFSFTFIYILCNKDEGCTIKKR